MARVPDWFGGRPMTRLGSAFTDIVSGEPVSYWRDRRGRGWLAVGPWSLFRVECPRFDAHPAVTDSTVKE